MSKSKNTRRIASSIFVIYALVAWNLAAGAGTSTDIALTLPGSGGIDGSDLVEYRITSRWGTQRLIKGEVDGRKTWNIINEVLAGDNPLVDHMVLDRDSLELMGRFSPFFAIGQHYLAAVIQDQALSGSLNPIDGGEPIIVNTELDSSVFEEASLGLVLAALPLEVDYRATLPRLAISRSTQSFSTGTIDIHVTGREEIKAGDGKSYLCWVVEAKWDGVDYQEIQWIADVPPYSIQKKATFPNGKTRESGFTSVTTSD